MRAEHWSGFRQWYHFARDNIIDLSVKGKALVRSQDMWLGYSDSHTLPQVTCELEDFYDVSAKKHLSRYD